MFTFQSNFDGEEFKRSLMRQAENQFKEQILAKVETIPPDKDGGRVTVSFSGSMEADDLKIDLSGPEELLEKAKEILELK